MRTRCLEVRWHSEGHTTGKWLRYKMQRRPRIKSKTHMFHFWLTALLRCWLKSFWSFVHFNITMKNVFFNILILKLSLAWENDDAGECEGGLCSLWLMYGISGKPQMQWPNHIVSPHPGTVPPNSSQSLRARIATPPGLVVDSIVTNITNICAFCKKSYLSWVTGSWALVAHACNPSYPRNRHQEDCGWKPAQANSSWNPISNKTKQNPITKKKSGVVA
jgi:hypothetical protein